MRGMNDGGTWSPWEDYATSSSWTLPSSDGSKTVYVEFRDAAGNVSSPGTISDDITLDTTGPTGTITIDSGAAYTSSTAVELTLNATSASDEGAGVDEMRLGNGGSTWDPWEAYATSKPWTLPSGDGSKTVYVEYRDAVDNVSSGTISDDITLDTMPPESQVTGPTGVTSRTNLTVSWTAGDTGSGIRSVRIYWNRESGVYDLLGDYPLGTTSAPFDASAHGGDGQYGFYSQAADAAGNVEDAPDQPDVTVTVHVSTQPTRAGDEWLLLE
jgi:hypothetical protein